MNAPKRLAPPRMDAALAGTFSEVHFASFSISPLRQPGALRSDRLRQPSKGRTDDGPLTSLKVCDSQTEPPRVNAQGATAKQCSVPLSA